MTRPSAVFIGPMASGKTRLGKRVARLLSLPFHDTDAMVTVLHGNIPDIFRMHGEDVFRRWEREAVREALAQPGIVSLGGGAILDEDTQHDLGNVPVVYLHAAPEVVAAHISTRSRPLLTDGIDSWKRIFEARRPIYERLASLDVDTSSANLTALAQEISTWIANRE